VSNKPRKTDIQISESKSDAVRRRVMDWSNVVPGIGPIVNALTNEIIPDSRMERLAAFMQYLEARINRVELGTATQAPDGLDFFEEGMWQAARALSDERKQHIATLVANGLKAEPNEKSEIRHFIRILPQLDDRQIILLCGYLPEYQVLGDELGDAFFEKHEAIFNPPEFTQGGSMLISPGGDLNASMKFHLSSLGLLGVNETFESSSGRLDKKQYNLSPLGERFLRFLGLGEPEQ